MGLLDFAVHRGTKFTDDEIELLDKHFLNITTFTDRKYDFHQKYIEKDVRELGAIGVPQHEVRYRHKHFEQKNIEIVIECLKYNVVRKTQIHELDRFYASHHLENPNEVPEVVSFPAKLFFINIYGVGGFFNLIQYDNNGNVNLKTKKIFSKNVDDTFNSSNI
jgi:hypothetical protein